MTRDELLAYYEEHGEGAYDESWEEEDWFEDLIKDKEVVMAMVKMSDAQCLLHGRLADSDAKKDKDIVLTAIEIYRDIWGDYDEDDDSFDAEELWDLVDESLRKDSDIINEIGAEF
jgi:hypothetical protein